MQLMFNSFPKIVRSYIVRLWGYSYTLVFLRVISTFILFFLLKSMPAARDIKGMVLKRMSISMPEGYFFFICTPTRLLQMFMIIFLKSVTRFESGLIGGWGVNRHCRLFNIYMCVTLFINVFFVRYVCEIRCCVILSP